jgi:hypothetical protein
VEAVVELVAELVAELVLQAPRPLLLTPIPLIFRRPPLQGLLPVGPQPRRQVLQQLRRWWVLVS